MLNARGKWEYKGEPETVSLERELRQRDEDGLKGKTEQLKTAQQGDPDIGPM